MRRVESKSGINISEIAKSEAEVTITVVITIITAITMQHSCNRGNVDLHKIVLFSLGNASIHTRFEKQYPFYFAPIFQSAFPRCKYIYNKIMTQNYRTTIFIF